MKTITLILMMIFLSGCGIMEAATQGCGGDLDPLCDAFLGHDPVEQPDYESRLEELTASIETLRDEYEAAMFEANEEDDRLESLIHDLEARVATLESGLRVVGFVDPCGDGPGFDEVLMRMSDGSLMAYFESGKYRFLTILAPGVYRTTDSQKCKFRVTNDMEVL